MIRRRKSSVGEIAHLAKDKDTYYIHTYIRVYVYKYVYIYVQGERENIYVHMKKK